MAGADYLKCEVCGERIMFEPDRDEDIKVVCMECYKNAIKEAAEFMEVYNWRPTTMTD